MSDCRIKAPLEKIQKSVREIAVQSGRPEDAVKLIAVSKTYPVDDIKDAYVCGQRLFGENRVQELSEKAPQLPEDVEWHLIGHLQRNKVKQAVMYADYIHAVDSEKLLRRIETLATELNKCPKVLIEVNVSGEESKFGVRDKSEVESIIRAGLECKSLEIVGLMTMAPFGATDDELHHIFGELRRLKIELEDECCCQLPELSMGMSGDYPVAISEGATFVRIGTAIFGKR